MPPKQALSDSERQRKRLQRIKADPVKYELYLKKQREKYRERKENGALKTVNQLSTREQRQQRKRWRLNTKAYRERNRLRTQAVTALSTPPHSPTENEFPEVVVPDSRPKKRGRPRLKNSQRSKAYRRIVHLENQLEEKERVINRLRKREYRKNLENMMKVPMDKQSPRTKTESLIKKAKSLKNPSVRKTLLFHHALVDQLRKIKHRRWDQKKLLNIVRLDILRKYRCQNMLKNATGISRKIIDQQVKPKQKIREKSKQMRESVRNFFLKDDNTRISAAKKDCVGDEQKRFLLHPFKVLHNKYQSESSIPVSYTFFCKNRPANVVIPKLKDRDVCVCKICDNFAYQIEKLHREKVVTSPNTEEVLSSLVCSTSNIDCMFRCCVRCRTKKIRYKAAQGSCDIQWQEWRNSSHTYRSRDGETKETRRVMKFTRNGTLITLVNETNKALDTMLAHTYRIHHQYKTIKSLKDNLPEDHCIMHFDYSENWSCKYSKEIASVHFGASQQQATLHDGVIYTNNGLTTFCTISDSPVHDASAVFAHLRPVIAHVKNEHPSIKHIHCVTDSPSSQYRNKTMFYLMGVIQQEFHLKITWNYLESGHGKGAADGVGAAIKRKADRMVAHGADIPDAMKLFTKLSEDSKSEVKLFYVTPTDINIISPMVPTQIRSYPGTMSVHQVWPDSDQAGNIHLRKLSCYCGIPYECNCHDPKSWNLVLKEVPVAQVDVINQVAIDAKAREKVKAAHLNPKTASSNKASKGTKRTDKVEDCECLVCGELYSNSRPGEDWVQCTLCAKWAHELCTSGVDVVYTCDLCT